MYIIIEDLDLSVILWENENVCYSVEISFSTNFQNMGFEQSEKLYRAKRGLPSARTSFKLAVGQRKKKKKLFVNQGQRNTCLLTMFKSVAKNEPHKQLPFGLGGLRAGCFILQLFIDVSL
jgi:hypothetical protein